MDLLPDRQADTLAAWPAERLRTEIVCRDRAPFYAEGATRGAPQALQVADRWHLSRNLREAAEKCVYRHRGCPSRSAPGRHRPAPSPAGSDGIRTPSQTSPVGMTQRRHGSRGNGLAGPAACVSAPPP
ncbi:transposase [Streptomyces auratus]|uniref:transposase n=1 Tax=Streptomyces auratus TaxID=114687 RepID=UPI003CCE72CB